MKNVNNDTPEIGQLIRLDVTLRSSGLWLGPTWAIICGIVASGGWKWSWPSLLQAVLILFLVDGAWATLWAAAAETDWVTPAARWGQSAIEPPQTLPYTQPDTPGDRLQRWLAHTLQWWREHLRPSAGSAVSTIILCVALGAALSAVLGWPAVALSAAAAAIVQVGIVVGRGSGRSLPLTPVARGMGLAQVASTIILCAALGVALSMVWDWQVAVFATVAVAIIQSSIIAGRRRGWALPALKASLDIGLAWLLAHAIFAPLTIPSMLLAIVFSATYAAGVTFVEGGRRATVWNAAQFAAAGLLVLMRIPIAALVVFLIVIPQLLLEPALRRGAGGVWFARSTQAWLMLGMLVATVSIS